MILNFKKKILFSTEKTRFTSENPCIYIDEKPGFSAKDLVSVRQVWLKEPRYLNLFLIAPFPDRCLLVPYSEIIVHMAYLFLFPYTAMSVHPCGHSRQMRCRQKAENQRKARLITMTSLKSG